MRFFFCRFLSDYAAGRYAVFIAVHPLSIWIFSISKIQMGGTYGEICTKKRYKSLPGLGNIPAKTKESSEVWLNGKMFLALLIEKYPGDIDFSPSWNIRTEPECVERDEIGVLFDLCNVTSR